MKTYTRFMDFLEWLADRMSALLIVVMITMIFVQVVNRYLLGISWPYLQFIIPWSFVWLCLLGSAAAARKRLHFEVDMFSHRLGWRGQHWYAVAVFTSVLAGGVVLVATGVGFADLGLQKKDPSTGTSMVWTYSALAVGGALISLFALEQVIRNALAAISKREEQS